MARFDLTGRRVYVAGHTGMVGSAVMRRLARESCEIVVPDARVDLREQRAVRQLFAELRPEVVVLAAARVGGILANDTHPAQFLYDNLMIEANIIEAARGASTAKLIFLGSSCIYPRLADQPISESALLSGPLEPTNEWYAIAKIAGIKLCQAYRREYGCDFISAMPTNLYGPGDNYELEQSHVVPALLRKAHEAKAARADHMEIWGTGVARREFLHVDDLAHAIVFLLQNYSDSEPVNVGFGTDISIADLSHLICEIVGFEGSVLNDVSKPDGTPRKLLDSSRIAALGWEPSISLRKGLHDAYEAFCATDRI